MRMNKTCYKQYDTRWAKLPYPRSPWLIRNCGCGEVSICNAIIDMEQYKSYTPKTIQPYMKQFADSKGNGTYHYGIPAAMKHFGMTEVAEHATMAKLWEQLRKGGRDAVLLMGSRSAGSKGVKWTGCGHFVEVSGYKEEGGKHWVYVKDSASTSSYRNGWITYEDNIRGACLKCWSGKLNGKATADTTPTITLTPDGKLTIDGVGGISTVKAMQRFFGTTQDGVITGQNQSCAKWYPALKSVKYGKGGSTCVRMMQKWLGITQDGVWGKATSIALQKKLGVSADGIFGAGSMKAWQKYLNANEKAVYPTVSKPTTSASTPKVAQTKAQQISAKAVEYAWAKGTAESKYKKKGGSPTSAFKSAWKKYFPKDSINTGCHSYVNLVLKSCGYSGFPSYKWSDILSYLRKNFTELKVNYSQSQLRAGDIRVHKNSSGGYHIWVIVDIGGKLYRAEANQAGSNPRYAHINTSNSGNTKKHKGDWLFRAK